MAMIVPKKGGNYTYNDYLSWPDSERWEIIEGEAYAMTPAPNLKHQRISREIFSRFAQFFRGKRCEPFCAPTDVVLDEQNVVQPDILVVCDPEKMRTANIQGTPDMIVEILSPSTTLTDRRDKLRLYERFGVREYLIVDPEQELVERYSLENVRYGSPDIFNWDEIFPSFSFPEFELHLWEVFAKEKP
jgi:Uma2 family endonuclease